MTAMDELPLVLVHVLPPFEIPFKGRLQSRFQLIDSSDSTFSPHARVLLCVGPAPVSSDTLRHLPSLQCIVGSSAGVDHIDLEECRRRGITVTNAGSSFCEDGADFAIGLLIDVLRRISAADRYVRAGLWPMKGDYPLGSKVNFVPIYLHILGLFGWWENEEKDKTPCYWIIVFIDLGPIKHTRRKEVYSNIIRTTVRLNNMWLKIWVIFLVYFSCSQMDGMGKSPNR